MALYTVGRRRVILGLLLTSALLLTLDIRGNAVLDRVRDAFSGVMQPIEGAAEVITTPVTRVWRGVAEYDDLERENQLLQDRMDRLVGTEAASLFAIQQLQALRALLELPALADIPTAAAEVVGRSANNFDQTVEINKGRLSGIRVGMPVVNQAGLVGKITNVTLSTATVQLITDPQYSVAVQVQANVDTGTVTATTSPSGRTAGELRDLSTTTTTTIAPSTTLATDVVNPDTTLPQNDGDLGVLDPLDPDGATPDGTGGENADPTATPVDPDAPTPATTTTTTTTTIPDAQPKEFGGLEGRGAGELPVVRFLQDVPSLAVLGEGDIVFTAGGFESLAPPDIPVGVVVNRADRSATAGPLLQVEPYADLGNLAFVNVVLYTPLSEVEQ